MHKYFEMHVSYVVKVTLSVQLKFLINYYKVLVELKFIKNLQNIVVILHSIMFSSKISI